MPDKESTRDGATRRDYLKYGAVLGGGLFAGCSEEALTQDDRESDVADPVATGTGTPGDASYSVTMAPVGEVAFDAVPETVYAYSPHYADMAVAYGHGDAIASLGSPDSYAASLNYYYDAVDGAAFDSEGVSAVWNDGVDKELFYDIDADVHLQDPCWLLSFADGWSRADVDEVRDNVGPWIGNRYSREHTRPPEGCREGYRYYSLWELSAKVAAVFRERERFRALRELHESLYGSIRTALPPKSERPTVGLVVFREGAFRPYEVNSPGFAKAHVRPLGALDAFADSDQTYDENYEGELDYEGMLEADPDVILHLWGTTPRYEMATVRERLRSHSVGSELTAVRDDRVYAQGMRYQGPLMNLFQIEMTAKQLYPDVFGEWPGYEHGDHYPEIPAEERLFDRERVADIVTGN
jgi:ABC-type Fe3+-hydroxamate transport system substrate-binding protein